MRRESRSALLLWALASVHAQTGSITLVESDKAFEHEVMGGDVCCRVQRKLTLDGDRHLAKTVPAHSVAPKALPRRGRPSAPVARASCQLATYHYAKLLRSGLLGCPLHLEQHGGAN